MQPALQAFERRLDPRDAAPLAVAFSGGGDSLALLMLAKAWADRAGRRVLALTVDHGLQPQSAGWTRTAAATAQRLGVGFRALEWRGDKPQAGRPAAARTARHRLIAQAARQAGAKVVLVGHTLDDQLENVLMRGAGERLGVLREWNPSPMWPEGRDLFHFRPLLALRRADLRAWLAGQGLDWIDDPANDDLRHPRARARARLTEGDGPDAPRVDDEAVRRLAQAARAFGWGGIVLPRASLCAAPPQAALRLLQITVACASGRSALGRPARAEAILRRLGAGERFIASLGGARIVAERDLLVTREAGEFERAPGLALPLEAGRATVWDGRFELTAERDGMTAQPLRGHAAHLQSSEKAELCAVPAAARGALPVILGPSFGPTCPILAGPGANMPGIKAIGLVQSRFAAAGGLIEREATTSVIGRMADWPQSSYVGAEY